MSADRDWLALLSVVTAVLLVLVGQFSWVSRIYKGLANLIHRFASHRVIACVAVAGLIMGVRRALLPLWPKPVPRVYDEFSYLLMADTFAAGRATNPTPPQWEHFETMFVQLVPSYQSVYPASQGLILALGMVVFGHPWWGVLLEMGIFGAALCWMLLGWLPPVWALLGSFLALLQFGVTSFWMNSYWGGATSAIGGALLLGAWPRLIQRPTRGTGVVMAVAIALLANSRPWEGFWLNAAVLFFLAAGFRRKGAVGWRVFAPAAAVLLVLAIATAWYFWRVTGSPLRMPYQVAFDQYAAGGVFFWEPLRHPQYRHEMLERFYVSMAADIRAGYSSAAGILRMTIGKLYTVAQFYIGPLLFAVLAMVPALVVNTRTRRLLICFLVVFVAMFVTGPVQVHYAAPLASLFILISTCSLRRFWLLKRRAWTLGVYLVPAICILMVTSTAIAFPDIVRMGESTPRARVLASLATSGTKHLVFVRYSPSHTGDEWVYNDADLDSSGVIWARDMGDEKNRELVGFFKDRRTWIIEPDTDQITLREYH